MNFRNLLLSVAAIAATPLFAATYYVTPEGAGSKNGSSWDNAFGVGEFRTQALKNADGDVYNFAAGTYTPTESILFKKGTYAVLNGCEEGRTIFSGDINNDGEPSKGDLKNIIRLQVNTVDDSKKAFVKNIDFTNVHTDVPTDDDNDDSVNGVTGAGALYIDNSGSVTVENCNFYNNVAVGEYGGAATQCRRSTVIFKNCIFYGNTANKRGGAIRLRSGDNSKYAKSKGNTTFENCIIKDNNNSSELGGAIFMSHGVSLNIINTTICNNKAATKGAAIYANSSNDWKCAINIINSTIAGNEITGEVFDGQITSTQYADIHTINSIIVSNNDKTADFYFSGNTSSDKFSFTSGGYNYVGNVVDMANQVAATVEETAESSEKIKWQNTDNVNAENTYASIFGDNTLNSDNQLVPVKYVAGASGEQVTSATADWGLPAGLSLATDAAGNTRAAGMTPGANSYTEQQIKDFTTSVITVIDDAANAPRLVKVANGVYTVEGTTEGVTVYTVNGATVAATSGKTIDLSSFANGLYIIKSGNAIFKVMK